jgi:flagellar basal-body rod modification protein FlgD
MNQSPDYAGAASAATSRLANQQTFLQLLVAQMKNQNPLNPTDGTQFVTQLAQFSQLEQMIAVRQDADAIRERLLAPPQPSES